MGKSFVYAQKYQSHDDNSYNNCNANSTSDLTIYDDSIAIFAGATVLLLIIIPTLFLLFKDLVVCKMFEKKTLLDLGYNKPSLPVWNQLLFFCFRL